jgi:hypothetical protein
VERETEINLPKTALLSCGISILETWPESMPSQYADVVGVNWASHRYAVDWHVGGDCILWQTEGFRMPLKGIAAYGEFPEDLTPKKTGKWIEWAKIDSLFKVDGQQCQYNFPYALRWALERWPERELDVYGVDMQGSGISPTCSTYPQERWDRERFFIDAILEQHEDKVNFIGCKAYPQLERVG